MDELICLFKKWLPKETSFNCFKDHIQVIFVCIELFFLKKNLVRKQIPGNGTNIIRSWSTDAFHTERVWWPFTNANMESAWLELAIRNTEKVMGLK